MPSLAEPLAELHGKNTVVYDTLRQPNTSSITARSHLPRRRSPVPIRLLLALGSVVLSVLVYVFGLSWWQASRHSYYEPQDLYSPRCIDVVVALWCFWVGSSVGSFLNVVAWRMPRGESVNGRSYCPRCQSRLKPRDNFPVFGWLALRGRCRTCRLPISPRYPIVELMVGITITWVSIGELYKLSLPYQSTHWHGGPLWAPVIDKYILVVLFYHVFGLSLTWAQGLIRLDRNPLPLRLTVIGLGSLVVAMCAYPPLMTVPWQVTQVQFASSMYVHAIIRVLTSLAAAALVGRCLTRAFCPTADPKLDPLGSSTRRLMDVIVLLAVPAVLVGWQAILAITVIASFLAIPLRRWLGPRTGCDALGGFAVAIPIVLTIQLSCWRHLYWPGFWPTEHSSPWVILSWAAVILLIPLWLRDRDQGAIGAPKTSEVEVGQEMEDLVESSNPPADEGCTS